MVPATGLRRLRLAIFIVVLAVFGSLMGATFTAGQAHAVRHA